MASPINAALCAMVAAAFWSLLGYALGRRLLPRVLASGAAPVMGWAVHSAVVLPIFFLIGFTPISVGCVAALCIVGGGVSLFGRPLAAEAEPAPAIPAWAYAAAAVLALAPAVAILPKFGVDGVHLADPIFDHSKIAIIDAMKRLGLPPVNPVFGEFSVPGRIAYYYLWHFSAAELALPLAISGWEADIGLTWFTAFASLCLMMGLAVWLSKRSGAAIFVVLLAATASLRFVLGKPFGSYELVPFLQSPSGFAGWLFQSAWVPQHLMSASCVVLSMLLLVGYALKQNPVALLTLVLTVTAGFESSTFVGGVTFAIAAVVTAPVLFFATDRAKRLRVAVGLAAAALLVICFAAPFIRDQMATVAARANSQPISIHHFEVLGELFPPSLRRVLDVPAYWLILLPIEFPATYIAGLIALLVMLRSAMSRLEKITTLVLALLTVVGLSASWLLVDLIGYVNDLGLRAVLPAAMILIVAAAAGLMLVPRRALIIATAMGGLLLSVPDLIQLIRVNAIGHRQPDDGVFAQSPELWSAVRRYTKPSARVANNPLYLQDMAPWPVNISWALLANRSSCFAGRELALAFAPLPAERREAIDAQFDRVFDGTGTPADVEDMAKKYACDVVVIVPEDKAWNKDPFAASPDYRLAESRDGKWRIYVRIPLGGDAKSPQTN